MKTNIKKIGTIILSSLAILCLHSCKKEFLEVEPKGKLIAQTLDDYNQLLNNLDFLNQVSLPSNGRAEVPMGDEVAAVEPFFSGTSLKAQRLFRRDSVIYEPNENAAEMSVALQNIYTYNTIINEVFSATDGTEQQKKQIQAEAMAGRAWTYFSLINYYGKPYNGTTSATDAGFPIITKADVTEKNFTRASVREVYDFIVNDLTTAIANLPLKTTHRLRMSRAAAEGLLGKVYMFMANFEGALPLLDAAFTDLTSSAIAVRLYDYNLAFAPGGSFLPMGLFGPRYPLAPDNEEIIYAKQFSNDWTFRFSEFVISPQTVTLFDDSDLRLKFYRNTPFPSGDPYPSGMLRRIGPTSTQFGVIVPDLYLLRAECKARLDDLAGAKNDVESLRIKRMPAVDAPVPESIASDKVALVTFILEERIREFAMQGYRWFDMRRLSVDPVFNTTINYTHTLYDTTGSTSTFALTPARFVLKFPQKIIDQNPGMQNNE